MELPERYRRFIAPFISTARGRIEAGHRLVPMAFVANLDAKQGIPILLDMRNDEGKHESARAIEKAVVDADADCILTIMEAWGLPPGDKARYEEIRERYGSITNYPGKVDALNLVLETGQGIWTAQVPIESQASDKEARTFGEVALQYMEDGEGQYEKFLPARH